MTNTARGHLRSAIVGGSCIAAIILGLAHIREGRLRYQLGLKADSLEASRDTTRRLTLAFGVLAQGSQLVQRRAVQQTQRADSLDRALGLERKVRADIGGQVPEVRADATAVQQSANDDTRLASWDLRSEPYTVHAEVVMPPMPAPATIQIGIRQDPIPLGFRVHCGPKNEQGIRRALLNVSGPTWFKINLQHVEQTPELCNPQPPRPWRQSWTTLAGLRGRVGVYGGGSVVAANGQLFVGPSLSAGVKLWP